VIVHVVDIGGIVAHHSLSFLFISSCEPPDLAILFAYVFSRHTSLAIVIDLSL